LSSYEQNGKLSAELKRRLKIGKEGPVEDILSGADREWVANLTSKYQDVERLDETKLAEIEKAVDNYVKAHIGEKGIGHRLLEFAYSQYEAAFITDEKTKTPTERLLVGALKRELAERREELGRDAPEGTLDQSISGYNQQHAAHRNTIWVGEMISNYDKEIAVYEDQLDHLTKDEAREAVDRRARFMEIKYGGRENIPKENPHKKK